MKTRRLTITYGLLASLESWCKLDPELNLESASFGSFSEELGVEEITSDSVSKSTSNFRLLDSTESVLLGVEFTGCVLLLDPETGWLRLGPESVSVDIIISAGDNILKKLHTFGIFLSLVKLAV